MLRHKWEEHFTPSVQISWQKRLWKDCENQREEITSRNECFSGQCWVAAHINAQ